MESCRIEHHTVQTTLTWIDSSGGAITAAQKVHCPLGVTDYAEGLPSYLAEVIGRIAEPTSWTLWRTREAVTDYLDSQVPENAWRSTTADM